MHLQQLEENLHEIIGCACKGGLSEKDVLEVALGVAGEWKTRFNELTFDDCGDV